MTAPDRMELVDESGKHILFVLNGGVIPATGDIVEFADGGEIEVLGRQWLIDLEGVDKPAELRLKCRKAPQHIVPVAKGPRKTLQEMADKAKRRT